MKNATIRMMFTKTVNALAERLAGGDNNSRVKGMRNEKTAFHLCDKGATYLAESGIEPDTLRNIFPASGEINPTVPYRFVQFVNGLHTGLYRDIDGTTARALIALRMSGGTLTRDALNLLLTGKVKVEGVSPETKGVGVRSLDQYIGRIGRGTVETQLSRSFGANGFAVALGMVSTSGRTNFAVTLNPENKFTARFFSLVDRATDAQLAEMTGAGEE